MKEKNTQHLTNDDISVVCDTFTATTNTMLKTMEDINKTTQSKLVLMLVIGVIIGFIFALGFILLVATIPI